MDMRIWRSNDSRLTFNLAEPTNAFMLTWGASASVLLHIYNDDVLLGSLWWQQGSNYEYHQLFRGFTSDVAFNRVRMEPFSPGYGQVVRSYGTSISFGVSVPAPAAFALMGALLPFAYGRRRR